ncbi:hypothetical protein ACFT8W_20775 [Streptomyces hygroscopicus]|uniref:hypothetical protein n=1 Tax=Streptomyces hygroscopicus TaxID=1912 RepID=UPI0036381B4C
MDEAATHPVAAPLPEGSKPVEGVPGYHALIKGTDVTVFSPDGAEIISASRGYSFRDAVVGKVAGVRLVGDSLMSFAEVAARHHLAAAAPGVRDRVWVRWEEDGVAAVYGTDKDDGDDRRAVKAGNLYWSGQRQGWATGRRWNPGTRDRNLAAVLLEFSRQDRNVVVLGPGQTPEDLVASPTAAADVPAQQVPPAAAPTPEPEPEPEDFTGLSYEELVEAEDAAATERSLNYTTAAERRYQALRTERGRRLVDRVATATPVTELSDEDLAAEGEWWQKALYKTPFHSSDEEYRTLQRRKNAVSTEQYVRTARTILAGPPVADLDDEALESAYERIGPAWTRLPRDHELHDQVTDRRKALQEERVARRARSYGKRTPVGEMTLDDLIAESKDLGSDLNARNEQSAYSYSEAVKEARAGRLRAVEAEWERRGLEQHPDAARATLGPYLGSRRGVLIDGSARAYGYMERQGQKFRALTSYDQRSSIGDFDSGPAAMAALVQRYDQDPEMLPRRTWGPEREVVLPSSSYDPLVSWLRRRPGEVSREFARVLELLTPYGLPTQTKVMNPLTNQVMRAYPFSFEEGLLGELARIAERTTEDLREQSLNEELPKREREAAKRRIPAMGAALIGINAVIEQVRAAGGDVERRGVDQSRLAAQMAALNGTVNEQEGGEANGDDEPVRDAAAQVLGGVPATGTVGDPGPGPVLPDAGDADERGDRRGGGGPGGEPGAGDGLPGPDRSAGADQGDGAGAGAARDAAAAGGRGGPGGAAEPGGGGAGGDPQGAGEPVARFRPDPADLPRGPLARAEANLEAIKVLRTLESGRRGATTEEKRVLARWSGWGSVPTVFLDEPDPDEPIYRPGGEWEGRFETDHARWESYSRVRGELRDLLDPFEWRAASRAVLSAHYTPQALAEAMWQGLAAYGFDGGEVLEAGCGSGAFFGVAPETARLTGVEVDPTTAAIAARIYPHANVLSESFADTDAPVRTFDVVIGNVPFAQAPFGERRYGATGHSLHNGFIIKQLALLRPGGYMAVITSRWTLDGEDTSARRAMSRWGDLAAAYRLPAGTFGETADTDVVADVLVFRRRAEGEEPGDQTWIDAPERELGGNTLPVNAYFTQHPENVLGRLTSETGPYGPRVTVQGDPGEAPRLLREQMEASAAAAVADGQGYVPHEDGPDRAPLLLQTAREKHATDFTGRLYTDDHGQIWQHVNGEDPVRVITADGVTGTEQLRMLLSLRDTASELRELDRTGSDPDRAREVRSQLARLHSTYTMTHGPLSRPRQTRMALPTDEARAAARAAGVELDDDERLPTGWGWFRQDPHAAVVLGLEHWDRANDRPVPSEVLTRRPGARRGGLKPTDDPKTALTAVMGATGGVDLPLIASLLGTTPEEARRRLGTEVFDNPVTKKLEHAGAYLSGPVRVKLEQAREAAATDPTYAVNVAALEAVQPPPKRLGQFTAQLGAHWIPAPLVQGFLREYLGDPTLQVSHNERYGWSLAAGKVPDAVNALKGTERRSAVHIAKALLGRASMVVNTLDGDGVDEDATRAMRYKADAMRSAFEDYCTASTARVTLLTDAYNRQMNGHVVRSYDGLAPTLDGFTTERTPHPWQLSAAARMQFERGVVLAHEVGLGKTTTMVMGSQALKASGQIAKPFAVVQPHLARQWLDEAKLLYPNADIRLITREDLADGNRRPVLEWLRANTPDLVIFTEGAFGSIRMSPEQQELYLFREIESLKEQLKRERGVPHNNFALMQLERRLTTVEARIRRNAAPMRTPGEVYWEDLGFDYALVDEAHRFTAVGFRSKEAGGEAASVRAVDMHQKLRWHHQVAEVHGGRPTVTLGTGTPMENSIFEQYSVLELATPWLLDQFGVHGPDLWSETFGQKVQRIEMAPDGSGLTIVERFSRFVSKSTMKTMWGLATDTKTGDDVGIVRPKLAGGAPELVLVEPTADQRARLQTLVARGQAIHAGDVTRDEDNMLAVSGEGRAVALDPRLVDANAPAANKLVTAADIIAAGYHAHKDRTYAVSSRDDTLHPVPGGLFFVFCNSGTPGGNNKGGFDAYAELRDLLAARGVPRDMVQFAQDNATPEKKAAMSEAANNGGIAVLMGSTEVLGTGFNGQNRAYALMHLDQDWTPASMIQRNGRVIRPGNQHEEVNIYFLATKGSMDAWQVGLLTSKAEGLRDIQRPPGEGDDDNDTVEEIGASDWDYATMAAEIGGNPFMRQFMEAKVHLQGLEADRRNAAADRVRQAELLLAKENELASTQRAIALRDAALPKVTATIRGDAFQIRVGGRDFDKRGEAGPVLRQAVADALRSHSRLGMGPWTTIGTFGGLDFAVRPQILDSGEIRAHVGFPDLRHSESVCSIGDLANPKFGGTIIGRLATALEKAEDHQLMDRERLPVLEAEITLLAAQHASVDYGPAIEHARRRVELLDAVVGAITERDKLPELTESMLDPERYRTPESRKKAIAERAEQRAPHQAKVDQAAAALAAFDETTPAPELPTAPTPTPPPAHGPSEPPEMSLIRQSVDDWMDGFVNGAASRKAGDPRPAPAAAPDAAVAEPTSSSDGRSAATVEPDDGGTEEPAEQTTEPPGDGHGTADLYETFGLAQPERVPTPVPQDEPEPGAAAEEPVDVPDGQMTVEEVQPEAAPAEPDAAAPPADTSTVTEHRGSEDQSALDRLTQSAGETEQLGLFGDLTPDAPDSQAQPDTARPAAAGSGETAPDDLVRAQLAVTEVTGAADLQYLMYGSWRPGEPDTIQFHITRQSRGVTSHPPIFSGSREACLAYIGSEAAVRSAVEAVDANSAQQAAALAWLRQAQSDAPNTDDAPAETAGGQEAPPDAPRDVPAQQKANAKARAAGKASGTTAGDPPAGNAEPEERAQEGPYTGAGQLHDAHEAITGAFASLTGLYPSADSASLGHIRTRWTEVFRAVDRMKLYPPDSVQNHQRQLRELRNQAASLRTATAPEQADSRVGEIYQRARRLYDVVEAHLERLALTSEVLRDGTSVLDANRTLADALAAARGRLLNRSQHDDNTNVPTTSAPEPGQDIETTPQTADADHDRSGGPRMDNPDPLNAPASGADRHESTPVATPEPRPREGEAYADQRAAVVRSALADDRVQAWAAEHSASDFAELFSTWLHNFVTTTAADDSTLREAFFGDPDRQEAFVSAAMTEVYSVLQEAGHTPPEEPPPAAPADAAVTAEAPDRREERGGEAADTEDLAMFTELPSSLGSSPPEPVDAAGAQDQPGTPGTEPDEADEAFAGLVEAVEDQLPGDMDEGLKADLLGELDARWAETKAAWNAALGPDAQASAGASAEDGPTAGAVNRVLREAQSTVADDPRASTSVEWRRISAVWEHTKRLRSWVEGVTVRWASGLLSDTRTHGFFRTVAARSCAAVASGALRLAGWLSPADAEGRTLSRTAQVLRRLSRVASSYSARLRGRPQDDAQTTAYDAISSELQALRDRSREPSELTPYASPKEQEQAAIDVSRSFLRVRDGMGEFLLGDHPRTEAFRSAWKGLPKTDEQGAAAAALYRRVAQHADALGPVAARSGQHNDALTALRALAGAAALHADRLMATHGAPPSAGSAAGGRRPRQQAAPAAPAVTRGGPERSGGGVAAGR